MPSAFHFGQTRPIHRIYRWGQIHRLCRRGVIDCNRRIFCATARDVQPKFRSTEIRLLFVRSALHGRQGNPFMRSDRYVASRAVYSFVSGNCSDWIACLVHDFHYWLTFFSLEDIIKMALKLTFTFGITATNDISGVTFIFPKRSVRKVGRVENCRNGINDLDQIFIEAAFSR